MEQNKIKIVERKIDDLIEAEYNPRKLSDGQKQSISDSIKRFGIVDPILVNVNTERKNIIIGGHQRTKVARELGFKKVPCIELDLNLDEEKELNIRLNKNTGSFDFNLLDQNFESEDLIEWGFEDFELSSDWDSDIDSVDNVEENLDGIIATIKITLKPDDKDSAINQIQTFLTDKGFVSFEIS